MKPSPDSLLIYYMKTIIFSTATQVDRGRIIEIDTERMFENSTISINVDSAAIVASTTFSTFILLLTVVGNSLVCFSVYHFPRLRKPSNYLIVSLAVSDLLVGALSIPFSIAQTVNGERFPKSLGLAGCRFWIWIVNRYALLWRFHS